MEKYKIQRKPLDETRKEYIWKIVEMMEKGKFNPGIDNLLQSFVYLILNDDFHFGILEMRKKLGIAPNGFIADSEYKKWKNDERLEKLDRLTHSFVEKNNLSFERHKPLIIEFIKNYILLKLMSSQSLASKSWSYNRFVGGFDVPDPKIGKSNTNDFDKIWWEIYFQPTDNITQFKRSLKGYFVWMMNFHYKDFYKSRLFELHNRDVLKTTNRRVKKPAELKIIQHKNKADLKFVTFLNTKTKEVVRTYELKQKDLANFKKKTKGLQKDNRAYLFSSKLREYLRFLDGSSATKIERDYYLKGKKQYSAHSKMSDYLRTQIKEVKKNVALAFQKKLSL